MASLRVMVVVVVVHIGLWVSLCSQMYCMCRDTDMAAAVTEAGAICEISIFTVITP